MLQTIESSIRDDTFKTNKQTTEKPIGDDKSASSQSSEIQNKQDSKEQEMTW